jgi:very-long-chain (3R)-3-hydroxyacyl-CoA dehydratase
MGVRKLYLFVYNAASAAAWGACLFLLVRHLVLERRPVTTVYESMGVALLVAQTGAVLELVHSLTGLVRSPFITTFLQVLSRVYLTWGAVAFIPEARDSWGFVLMVGCWCLVEVPRYAFYALKELGDSFVPYPLTWLRYSLFLVLYPAGITGELLVAYRALPVARDLRLFCVDMPNPYNFVFDFYYFTLTAMLLYLPGAPMLYSHMLKARAKNLAGGAAKDKHE